MPRGTLGILALALTLGPSTTASAQLQPPVFQERHYALTGYAYDVDLGDVDGDGDLDVGALSSNHMYELRLNIGDGGLKPGIVHSLVSSSGLWSTTLADVTDDGRADLLVVGPDDVFVERSNGDGGFQPIGAYSIHHDGNQVVAVDLNHDGLRDLAVAAGDWFPGGMTVWLGAGGGVFDHKFQLPANDAMDAPYTIEAADVHGDGHPDLVTRDLFNTVSLVRGNQDGTLQPAVELPVDWGVTATFADLDVDGLPDVITTTTTQTKVLLNQGDGSFAPPVFSAGFTATYNVPIGDFNCDGAPDVAGIASQLLTTSLGHGDGGFEAPLTVSFSPGPALVRSGDMDGDGSDDLVVLYEDFLAVLVNQRPAWPWKLTGTGLAGAGGVPRLHGNGSLQPGHPLAIALTHAAAVAPALLVVGPAVLGAPFKGGVLLPDPSLVWPLVTDVAGSATLSATMPSGLPSHARFYAQAWIPDAAPQGFAATNGLVGIVP